MAHIIFSTPIKIADRMVRELDLTEAKLRHRLDPSGAVHIWDDCNGRVNLTISPSKWDYLINDQSAR